VSLFNPDAYLDMATDAEMDTRLPPCPEGKWLFKCDAVVARANPQKEKDPSAADLILDYTWLCTDEGCLAQAERSRITVRQSVFVTVVNNTIEVGEGKNTRLGALRAAVGQNQPGVPWTPRMVIGQMAKLKITHRTDKDDPEKKYDNVQAIEPPFETAE
jgi:hypothetical protein